MHETARHSQPIYGVAGELPSRQPGCHNVQEIAINRVTAQHARHNWSLCVMAAGAADANTAARAAVHVQSILRRDYDLTD
jgi:hypothetical protein